MNSLGRREFLAFLGTTLFLPKISFARAPGKQDTILALLKDREKNTANVVALSRDGKRWKKIAIPMSPDLDGMHGIEVNPADPSILIVYPRRDTEAVVVSLRGEGRALRTIKAAAGYNYAGHGMFTPDGKFVYASEIERDGVEGFVSVRDVATGALVDKIHTGAKQPHQIVALDPRADELAVAHYGDLYGFEQRDLQSEVTFVDRKSKKVLHRVKKKTHVNAELCHMVTDSRKPGRVFVSAHDHVRLKGVAASNDLLKLTKYFPVPLFSAEKGSPELGALDAAGHDADLVFNFSIAISEKHDVIALAHTDPSRVSFWDTESGKLRKILPLPDYRTMGANVLSNGDEFFFSLSGQRAKLVFVNAKTLEVTNRFDFPLPGLVTSHTAVTSFPV